MNEWCTLQKHRLLFDRVGVKRLSSVQQRAVKAVQPFPDDRLPSAGRFLLRPPVHAKIKEQSSAIMSSGDSLRRKIREEGETR